MDLLTWWQGGIALAGVALLHWLLMDRMLAASARITVLIDRMRGDGDLEEEAEIEDLSPDEVAQALRDVTAGEFGIDALEPMPHWEEEVPVLRKPQPTSAHVLFFVGLVIGGVASALLGGGIEVSPTLSGELFAASFGEGAWAPLILVAGGVLVGFGTRMAGGCTTSHALCGVSRMQSGSLLATAAFFAAGVATSFLLLALR